MGREGGYHSEMGYGGSWTGIEAMVSVAAQHAWGVVFVGGVSINGFFLGRYCVGGIVEGAFEMGGQRGDSWAVICDDVGL